MNAREWIEAYAAELGIDPPTTEEFSTLLDLAGEAAHASERVAAPVACWLSAHAGRTPEESLEIARRVGAPAED
ncbi:MAG: hypothetical protein QOG86_1334 [Thermoleophilaceae bacterium]|nr:hypothetical protein [Thermoleophilaceae bacterium]